MSKNYQKTLKKYYKWQDKKNNKIQNAYHQISKKIVTQYDIIAMETLNIKGMFQNKRWAHKLQKISLYQLIKNAKIQSRMVRKKIHTNTKVLPIHKNMPHLRISK